MMSHFHTNAWRDERGTTAIEFAIVGPVFMMMVIGIFYLCLTLLVVASMHFAVEEGARCASVRAACSDEASTRAYTQTKYHGPSAMPDFNPINLQAPCGSLVSGSISYVMNLGLTQLTVPITASACFPRNPS